jgi:hypothetical protein
MPTIDEHITVERNPEEVFAFMSTDANVPLYSSNIQSYERLTDGGMEVGARHHGVVRVAGRTLEFNDEVVELDAGKRMVFRCVDGPIPYRLEISVEPAIQGATIRWHQETDRYGGFFGKLADPLVTKMYTRDVRANLANAKALMES